MGQNYFNSLPLRLQIEQLGKCRFMDRSEFAGGVELPCGCEGLEDSLLTCRVSHGLNEGERSSSFSPVDPMPRLLHHPH